MPGSDARPSCLDRSPTSPRTATTAALAEEIEARWQDRWDAEGTFHAPNPDGPSRRRLRARWPGEPKLFVLDMFPYPSGAGLHVGHPARLHRHRRVRPVPAHDGLQRPAHDGLRRLRAARRAVRGADRQAPAHHHRGRTSPTTAAQLRRLGLGHDPRRVDPTTDVALLPLDAVDLPADLRLLVRRRRGSRPADRGAGRRASSRESRADPGRPRPWASSIAIERREVVDSYRLAYLDEAPVNWCPGLGTVLANEEVTADGRSERGNFPVFRRPLKQWMLRITAYADRLIDDLDRLDWPESIKLMQRNWIGRSEGAQIHFPVAVDGQRHQRLHHPPRHAVRRDLHGARARAPAGRRADARGVARRHARGVDGRRGDARSRPSRRTCGAAGSHDRRSSARSRARRRPACSPARTRSTR